jgi:hypothetical protein
MAYGYAKKGPTLLAYAVEAVLKLSFRFRRYCENAARAAKAAVGGGNFDEVEKAVSTTATTTGISDRLSPRPGELAIMACGH